MRTSPSTSPPKKNGGRGDPAAAHRLKVSRSYERGCCVGAEIAEIASFSLAAPSSVLPSEQSFSPSSRAAFAVLSCSADAAAAAWSYCACSAAQSCPPWTSSCATAAEPKASAALAIATWVIFMVSISVSSFSRIRRDHETPNDGELTDRAVCNKRQNFGMRKSEFGRQ